MNNTFSKDAILAALDIYLYMQEVFTSKTEENLRFRINQGMHGCRDKVLNYIEDKYLQDIIKS